MAALNTRGYIKKKSQHYNKMFLNGNVITRHQLSNVVTPTLPSGDFIHVAMESVAEKR